MARKEENRQPEFGYKPHDGPRTACAHMACGKPAICKTRVTATAWSNFCYEHYIAWQQAQAEETCTALELKTTAQKRAWLKAAVANLVARMELEHRQPGEDDELAA